jgi:hypothetical protein
VFFAGERRVFEEVPSAKTPSRAHDDNFGVAFTFGCGDRVEWGSESQVCGGTITRIVD